MDKEGAYSMAQFDGSYGILSDYLYSAETYRAVPEEKNNRIIGWLDYICKFLTRNLIREIGLFRAT